MTIMLSDETVKKPQSEASRRGIRAEQLAEQLIDAALPDASSSPPNQSSIEILNEWEAQTATEDPQELARRQAEFEAFKKELNRTRLDTDGPKARIPFP
jgi:hypothetical protein